MKRIYLYGFVPSDAKLPNSGLLGVSGAAVELVALDEFAAAVSRVDPESYDAHAIEPHTADVEWMAEHGLRHEQVVAWFVDSASILPSRLLTLFSGAGALREAAARDRARIRAALDRFAQVREWDLKVGYHSERLLGHLAEVSQRVRELDREIEAATPGKRFLLEKKRAGLAGTETRTSARRLASELLETLRAAAEDVALSSPPVDAPVVLSAALLVPRLREPELRERVERERARLADLGMVIEFTGPWAPYRFLDTDV